MNNILVTISKIGDWLKGLRTFTNIPDKFEPDKTILRAVLEDDCHHDVRDAHLNQALEKPSQQSKLVSVLGGL